MSSKIWKYPIPKGVDTFTLNMPSALPLTVQMQRGEAMLWAIVNPESELMEHRFHILPTGGDIPDIALRYIGTFQTFGGNYIWHLFEETGGTPT